MEENLDEHARGVFAIENLLFLFSMDYEWRHFYVFLLVHILFSEAFFILESYHTRMNKKYLRI